MHIFCVQGEEPQKRFQNAKALGKARREKLIFAFPMTLAPRLQLKMPRRTLYEAGKMPRVRL